ncbi:MAG: hypothetical protein JRE23_17850 [Deltaproteobacteria bacterium]|nr:hypothetical protein [Deltaproteobacteria bacterium]
MNGELPDGVVIVAAGTIILTQHAVLFQTVNGMIQVNVTNKGVGNTVLKQLVKPKLQVVVSGVALAGVPKKAAGTIILNKHVITRLIAIGMIMTNIVRNWIV